MIDQYYENSNEKRKKNEIVLLLQLKTKSKVKKGILYWVNTRKLDGVPSTKCLSYIYIANSSYYTKSSLF